MTRWQERDTDSDRERDGNNMHRLKASLPGCHESNLPTYLEGRVGNKVGGSLLLVQSNGEVD